MKTLLLAITCLSLTSLSTFAGTCCGSKDKGGDKEKEAPKTNLVP